MRKLIIISILLLISNISFSQIATIDSLNKASFSLYSKNKELSKKYADSALTLAKNINYTKGISSSLFNLGIYYSYTNPKKANKLLQEALEHSILIDYKQGECDILNSLGILNKNLGNIDSSVSYHNQSFKIANEINYKNGINKSLINLASIYTLKGEFDKAIINLNKAIDIVNEIKDTNTLQSIYSNISNIYRLQGRPTIAIDYCYKALNSAKIKKDTSATISYLLNLGGILKEQDDNEEGNKILKEALELALLKKDSIKISFCYTNLGAMYIKIDTKLALEYCNKAIEYSKGNIISQHIYNLMNIGVIYIKEEKYIVGIDYLKEALDISIKTKSRKSTGEIYLKIATALYYMNNYSESIDYINKGNLIAKELNYTKLKIDCLELYSSIYSKTNNYKKAYYYYKDFKLLSDSLFNESNIKQIATLESSYKFEKEREILKIEQDNNRLKIRNQRNTIIFLLIITILIIIFSIISYRQYSLRRKLLQQEIKSKDKELDYNNKTIALTKLKLIQNNERHTQSIKKLESLKENANIDINNEIRSLINNYKSESTNFNWEEFETLFMKVDNNFKEKLNSQFPSLTPNERRLCIFLKLNMSNKDIAKITYQSEEALRKSRLRLRKKLNLDRSENLTIFIQNI